MIGGSDIARLSAMERRARQQAEAEAWPEGVIARYLTVGGATVDLTRSNDPEADDASQWDVTRSICTGCGATDAEAWNTRPYTQLISITQAEKIATAEARKWAQRHAEKCRAMPKPEAQQ